MTKENLSNLMEAIRKVRPRFIKEMEGVFIRYAEHFGIEIKEENEILTFKNQIWN